LNNIKLRYWKLRERITNEINIQVKTVTPEDHL